MTTKHTKDEAFLINTAETIGSTLGTIAARVGELPDAISHEAQRQGKKLEALRKTVARSIQASAAKSASRTKRRKAKKSARAARKTSASKKRIVRRAKPKRGRRSRKK